MTPDELRELAEWHAFNAQECDADLHTDRDLFTKTADYLRAQAEAQEAENERLRAALKTCVWALRQPLDGWKGECERKALDKARDALKEQR